MNGMLSNNGYKAYVLRLWSDGPDGPWRAVLDCARTGAHYPFATVVDLVAFLESETEAPQSLPPTLMDEDTGDSGKVKW